jgi:LysM repeat protein
MKRSLWPLSLALIVLVGCGQLISPPPSQKVTSPVPLHTPATLAQKPSSTPAPYTPLPTATPTMTPTPIIYIVKPGDTVLGIAAQFGVGAAAIQEVNGITDPRRLQVGQELVIPRPDEEPSQPPTSTPTPLPFTIAGLSFQETPTGGLWCLGEVYNTTPAAIEQVRVAVSLFNEAGEVVASNSAFIALDVVTPTARSPFAILFPTAPPFTRYEAVALSGVAMAPKTRYYLDLEAVDIKVSEQMGGLLLTGLVHNKGTTDADRVKVVTAGYDAEGHIVAMRETSLTPSILPAGKTAPFAVELTTSATPIISYTVQAQGLKVQ